MFNVVITEPINQAGVELLEREGAKVVQLPPGSDEATLMEVAPEADALITRGSIKVTREVMEASPRLRVVGVHGTGCDHVDLGAARELGKVVLNTPDALTVTVAEMALALTLSLTRRVVSADKAVRAGQWNRKYGDLVGFELMGKTVGVIGLGRIGEATVRRLRGFGVDILYHSRTRKPDLEEELGIEWAELDELLKRSDVVTLHVPYTAETHHLISTESLGMMKEGAYIVNTARGRIIDQEALKGALRDGRVAGAALDVFEVEPLDPGDELAGMENVVLTPHLAASSREGMRRMAVQVAEGVLKVLRGGRPDNPVVI